MKKLFFHRLTALLASLLLIVPAFAEETSEPKEDVTAALSTQLTGVTFASGWVLEVSDDRLLMLCPDNGMHLEVLLSEETTLEGVSALQVGDFIHVRYNGAMTRSIPAQIAGQNVACHRLTGVVAERNEEGPLLTTGDGIDVQVRCDAALSYGVLEGSEITVYYDGKMTFSLPGQINADFIRLPGFTGAISDLTEDSFLLTTEDSEYLVHVAPETRLFLTLEEGARVTVTHGPTMTLSLPGQFTAVEVLPAPSTVTKTIVD